MDIYNIALVFEEGYKQKIIQYAKRLYREVESEVRLGVNARPHLTVAQFKASAQGSIAIWEEFKMLAIPAPKLSLSGITILPSSNGGAWVEISVLKTRELLEIQECLLSILPSEDVVISGVGDNYRPHITIAHILTGNKLSGLEFDYEAMRAKNLITCYDIGLGQNFNSHKI